MQLIDASSYYLKTLIFTTTGGMGDAATHFYERLANL